MKLSKRELSTLHTAKSRKITKRPCLKFALLVKFIQFLTSFVLRLYTLLLLFRQILQNCPVKSFNQPLNRSIDRSIVRPSNQSVSPWVRPSVYPSVVSQELSCVNSSKIFPLSPNQSYRFILYLNQKLSALLLCLTIDGYKIIMLCVPSV